MKANPCERSWQVAAVRYGRLRDARDRVALERHLTTCMACRREVASLERIGRFLRDAPISPPDELARRRGRHALLSRAASVAAEPRLRAGRLGGAIFAVVSVAAAASFAFRHAALKAPALTNTAIEIAPVAGAVWQRGADGGNERVVLSSGTLAVRVHHDTRSDSHLLVVLPDGELEDVGTVFAVTVEGSRTSHVEVSEGAVELRLRGRAPMRLSASQSWKADDEERTASRVDVAALPVAPTSAPARPARSLSPAREPAATATPARPTLPASAPSLSSEPSAPEARAPALAGFDAAMRAFRARRYVSAATLFRAFTEANPTDTNVEDAMYLYAIALSRSYQAAASTHAARAYLDRFPHGFRAPEMRAMAE